MHIERHRRISCGCCTGDGTGVHHGNDQCVCWNHQDCRIARPPHVCALHAKLDRLEAARFENRSQALMDSLIMDARTLATGRGATPAEIERNVSKPIPRRIEWFADLDTATLFAGNTKGILEPAFHGTGYVVMLYAAENIDNSTNRTKEP